MTWLPFLLINHQNEAKKLTWHHFLAHSLHVAAVGEVGHYTCGQNEWNLLESVNDCYLTDEMRMFVQFSHLTHTAFTFSIEKSKLH